ncbi:lipopolysaccharide assembly LapA domain-containing protein [Virgibacillus sp. JSM 102003]|uniref:LapA family protein n=1 Tax=Virgibacillus sp. JSM 102003 TaxID=1562108 RepID=UPI0035BEEA2D
MRGQSYVILAIIFVIIVAIFAVINVDPVEVNYLFGTGEAPLILVILFSVLMGGIITAAVGLVKMIHLQREQKSLQAENKQLKETAGENQLIDDDNNQENPDGKKNL